MTDLRDRIVIVTGAASGIGNAVVAAFAKKGAKVVAADCNEPALMAAVATINEAAGETRVLPFLGDVASVGAFPSAIFEHALAQLGMPDTLCNIAGANADELLADLSEPSWNKVLGTHLDGTAFLCAEAARRWKEAAKEETKDGGNPSLRWIVNTASVSWRRGNVGQTAYTAAKGAIVALTKTAALELGRYGIRVNAVAPGPVDTPMWQAVPEKIRAAVISQIPLGRAALPAEIANVYMYLASRKASYISGTVIEAAGGMP